MLHLLSPHGESPLLMPLPAEPSSVADAALCLSIATLISLRTLASCWRSDNLACAVRSHSDASFFHCSLPSNAVNALRRLVITVFLGVQEVYKAELELKTLADE